MINIMMKEACNALDDLQARIDKLIEHIPADYPEETKEELTRQLDKAHFIIEYVKPFEGESEEKFRCHIHNAFMLFNIVQAKVWGVGAKSYRVTIVHESGNDVSTVIDRFPTAFDRLHSDINGRDVRMGILSAVKSDYETTLLVIFPATHYYELMDEVAATKRLAIDTAHIKDMAIQISSAQLFLDTVIFENDRKAYRAARKAAKRKAK